MQVKKKNGEKSILPWIYTFTAEFAQEAAVQLLLCCRWLFFCQRWHISEEQLITTIYKKRRAEKKILSSDQLSLRLPRRHAEPSSEKQHRSSSKEVVGFTGHDEHQTEPQENGGGGFFSFYPPPQPAPEKSVNSDTCFGGKRRFSGEAKALRIATFVPQTNIAALFWFPFSFVNCKHLPPPFPRTPTPDSEEKMESLFVPACHHFLFGVRRFPPLSVFSISFYSLSSYF